MTTLEPHGRLPTSSRSLPLCALLTGPKMTTPIHLNRTPTPSPLSFLTAPAPSPACLPGRCPPPFPPSTLSREGGMVSCVPAVSPGWVHSRYSAQSRMDEGWTYLDTEGKHVTHSPQPSREPSLAGIQSSPATGWHPQLQGGLEHCDHLAARKASHGNPWRWEPPGQPPGLGTLTAVFVHVPGQSYSHTAL